MLNYLNEFELLKKEIYYLNKELFELKRELSSLDSKVLDLCFIVKNKLIPSKGNNKNEFLFNINNLKWKDYTFSKELIFKQYESDFRYKTNDFNIKANSIKIKTDKSPFKPLKVENLVISTRNGGVPTDKQTNRQTDILHKKKDFLENSFEIDQATSILDSLDNLKKEVRLKFKKLTDQEMAIFSAIYQIEEEKGYAEYKSLAERLHLTESSIRDYVRRLLLKGIPLIKEKTNNKEVLLHISQNLRKLTNLGTLIRLREL